MRRDGEMSDEFGSAGLIGGLVGLAFGVADWLIFTWLVAPRLEESARRSAWEGQKRVNALPALRIVFLLSCFVALPLIGYVAGRIVLPGLGFGAGG
jgi:hypothetical protein